MCSSTRCVDRRRWLVRLLLTHVCRDSQVAKLNDKVKFYLSCLTWYSAVDDSSSATSSGALRLHAEGNDMFSSKEPLNIVAVCGKLRTGKSYLMNALVGGGHVFGVSNRADIAGSIPAASQSAALSCRALMPRSHCPRNCC